MKVAVPLPKNVLVPLVTMTSASAIYGAIQKKKKKKKYVWKKNLAKHWKVSKYYETDCLQNFLLHFMLLLTRKFVKNNHI